MLPNIIAAQSSDLQVLPPEQVRLVGHLWMVVHENMEENPAGTRLHELAAARHRSETLAAGLPGSDDGDNPVADSLPIRAVKTHSHLVKMRHLDVIPVTPSEGIIAARW
jgi:hypothetical protein